MTPVINPWIFYLMPICDNISFWGTIVGVLALIGFLLVFIGDCVNEADGFDDEDFGRVMKRLEKVLSKVAIIALVLSILVPSEKTLTKMLIAQNVTYERVEAATDTVQSVYEDIMGLFEEDDNG